MTLFGFVCCVSCFADCSLMFLSCSNWIEEAAQTRNRWDERHFPIVYGVSYFEARSRNTYTPPKVNMEPENDGSKRSLLLQVPIFRFHVKFIGLLVFLSKLHIWIYTWLPPITRKSKIDFHLWTWNCFTWTLICQGMGRTLKNMTNIFTACFFTLSFLQVEVWFFLLPDCLRKVHSGKQTQQWKMNYLKMYFLHKIGIFHCYII